MSRTPRDLKDITDLVAKKLEIYLNIDKREQHFDTEGCFRVSPRMHKYDVMYRLIENQDLEKKKHRTPRTPRSKTPVISRTRQKSPYLAIQYSVRSKSKEKKTSTNTNQKPGRPKTAADKSPARSRSSQRKGLYGKEKSSKISNSIDQKPIAVRTPRTPRSAVSEKEVKRLENYANLVYEEFPVEDLQKLHNLCPSLPNAGLAGNQRYQNGKRCESRSKSPAENKNKTPRSKLGSMSSSVVRRGGGHSRDRQTRPRSQPARSAVVRFISPESSDHVDSTTQANAHIIRSTRTVSSDTSDLKQNESNFSNSDKTKIIPRKSVIDQEQQTCTMSSDTSEINREIWSVENESRRTSDLNIMSDENKPSDDLKSDGASGKNTAGENDLPSEDIRENIESPFPRCRSRIGRQTSSLQVDYSSHTTEESLSVRSSDDASTRTNSPESSRESLQTPSSYREADSSDSGSSVLRYYTLSTQSTGAVYGSKSKSYKSPRKRNRPKTNSDESLKMSYNPISKKWDQEIVHTFSTVLPTKQATYSSSSNLSGSSSTPRYNIIPERRLVKRSSLTNSVSDSSEEAQMFVITPRSVLKEHRKRPQIDLNLMSVMKTGNSNISTTGEDDVFWDKDSGKQYNDEDNLILSRGEDYLSNESKQSRGSSGGDWSTNSRSKCERYHTLMRESGTVSEKDTQTADQESSSTEDEAERKLVIIDQGSDVVSTCYKPGETEPAIDDANSCELEEKKDVMSNCEKLTGDQSSSTKKKVKEEDNTRNSVEGDVPCEESAQREETPGNSTETSDVESLNRGSDGLGKDGRGKRRICSPTKRRSNRGCQWEDEEEISNKQLIRHKYKVDSLRDERGGYEIVPEHRGSSTEKGWQEGKSESYIIVIPKEYPQKDSNTTSSTKQQETECRGAIPPVRRSLPNKNPILQGTSTSQEKPEEENTLASNSRPTSPISGSTCGENSNNKKDAEKDEKIIPHARSIEENPDRVHQDFDSESERSTYDIPASQKHKHTKDEENFTLSDERPPKEVTEVRGSSNYGVQNQDPEPHILMKYRNSFPLSDTEMAMVFDLKEKTDEHRGSVGLTDVKVSADHEDHHENILGRGHSRDSSITSSLSWKEKYSGVDEGETDHYEEIAINENVVVVGKDGQVEESAKTHVPKRDKENLNDSRGDNDLCQAQGSDNNLQPSLSGSTGNPRSESIFGEDDRRVEGMLNQLEMLVQAKAHLLDGAVEKEDESARGEESEDGNFRVESSHQYNMTQTYKNYQGIEMIYDPNQVMEDDKQLQETQKDEKHSFETEKDTKEEVKTSFVDGHSDIKVLNSPCLAVSKSTIGEVLDLQKLNKKPKSRCKADTRGDLAPSNKQRRPRSAAVSKTSTPKTLRRRRSKSASSRS